MARPFGIELTGLPAQLVTRGHHLATVPSVRARVLGDWLLHSAAGDDFTRLGLVDTRTSGLADLEHSL